MARRKKLTVPPFEDIDVTKRRQMLEVSSRERDEIEARQAQTNALASDIQKHLDQNHFAQRLQIAFGYRGLK